jgi:hypothetical protein
MKRDEDLELVEDDEDLEDEDFDDEDLDDIGEYPPALGVRGFFVGVLVGAVVGAGVALLVAPDRGEVVRRRIGRSWRDLQDDARDQLDDWRGEARREVRKQKRRLRRKLTRGRRS